MLICEQLFLLLTTEAGTLENRSTDSFYGLNGALPADSFYGLNGALLTDLVRAGRVTLSAQRNPRVRVVDSRPTNHLVLDRALEILPTRDGRRLFSMIEWRGLNPTKSIAASLASAGIIEVNDSGFLGGLFPKYPTLYPVPEVRLRRRLYAVLRGEQPATSADLTLLAILHGLRVASRILPKEYTGLGWFALRRRIEEMAGADPAGRAVANAVGKRSSASMQANN